MFLLRSINFKFNRLLSIPNQCDGRDLKRYGLKRLKSKPKRLDVRAAHFQPAFKAIAVVP